MSVDANLSKNFPDELYSLNNLGVIVRPTSALDPAIYKDYVPSGSSIHFGRNFHMAESISNLEPLLTFDSPIIELPESIGRLSRPCIQSSSHSSLLDVFKSSVGLKSLHFLKSLVDPSFRKFSELPQIGQFTNLKNLNLCEGSNTRKLPDSIGDLKLLVELNIAGLGITEFPDTIGKLTKLEILCAWHCTSLVEIPSTIKGCTSRRVLDLGYCASIEKLPDSMGDLSLLAELYLSFTGISELPDTIGNLKVLKVIKMKGSRIQKLPTSIGVLKRLVALRVNSCEFLTEVPSEIEGCTSLRVLDLRGTGVNRLPPKLPPKLTNVQIGNC